MECGNSNSSNCILVWGPICAISIQSHNSMVIFSVWSDSSVRVLNVDWFPYYILFVVISVYGYITNNPKYRRAPLMNLMEYYPAVDIKLRVERTGSFITIVLGYIVINLIYQSAAVIGFNAYSLLRCFLK